MKALSINQPWAWLIVNGHKGVENRDWDTNFRGEFYIHAGKKYDDSVAGFLAQKFPHIILPPKSEIPMGGIVGTARLINVVHEKYYDLLADKDKPWFFGSFGFILDEQKPCDLMPCKGQLGFFTPDFNSKYREAK